MAIDIDLNKLDKLIKDHHKKCNQDDVYEYMINKNNKQPDNANEFEIDYDEFKRIVGEIICICQIIELDLKLIYACLYLSIFKKKFKYSSNNNWTLGETITQIENIQKKLPEPVFSKDQYSKLYRITSERNNITHTLVKSFSYLDDFVNSMEFKTAFNRINNFSQQVLNLHKIIQEKRVQLCKENDIPFSFLNKIING